MTEETESPTRKIAMALAVPVLLTAGPLTAFAYQQARAGAYTDHFGVHHAAGDPREAAVLFALVAFGVATLLWTLMMSVKTAAALSVPGAGLLFLAVSVLAPPYGWNTVLIRVVYVLGLWALVRGGAWALPRLFRAVRRAAAHPRGRTIVTRLDESFDRYDQAGAPMRPVVVVAVAAGLVIGAHYLGGYVGRYEAAAKTDFDVIGPPGGSTVTVIFTRTGDIVERKLAVLSGTDGKPRNVWLPGVVIRPMPEAGIEYRTVRLGPTQPSDVERR